MTQTTVVFYFSFDQWDVRRDSVRDMASTFLAQIICQFPRNKEWAEAFFEHLSYERGWTEADLLNWYEKFRFNNEFEDAIFVINHFDQCTNGSRRLFLDRLRFLASHSERQYKIVLTSQKAGALLDDLSGTPITALDLSASTQSPEGGTGRTNFVDETEKRLMQLRPELLIHASLVREQLESIVDIDPLARQILCEQAGVWSLWPETISFREMVSGDQGLDLPEGQWDESLLACLLDRILSKISDNESQKEKLRSHLSWILYAVRPLTVWELGNALLLSRKETAIKDSQSSPAMLENLVSGTLNELAGIVRVVHNEVRIVHPRIKSVLLVAGKKPAGSSLSFFGGEDVHDKGHYDIALLSLKYSSTPSGRNRIDQIYNLSKALGAPVFTDRGDLCAYALQAWTHHFLLVSPDSSQRKDLEQQVRIGGLPGLSHLDLARGYWALSNPITRSHTSLESLFPIFAGFGVLDDTLIETSETTRVLRAALLEASSKGQSKTVKQLLDRDKFTEETLLEALVLAGASGDEQLALDLVRYISNSSSSPSTIAWPPSLLFRSCSLGLSRLAEKLLQLGISADPDVPWTKITEASPLTQTVRFNHVAATEVLLRHGADTKFLHANKRTHLHVAASLGNAGILKPLCELGKAEVDAKSDDGDRTPAYFASLWGHHAAVEELLKLGADPNMGFTSESPVNQWNPITVAAEGGYQQCIKLLLQHKANPDARGPDEHGTALGYAAVNGHLEVCRLLLEAGADPNNSHIVPPLIWKVTESLDGQDKQELRLNMLKLLIEYGINVNAKTSGDIPVLSSIVRHLENVEAVCGLLLDKGADVNLVDPDGMSPLIHAACALKRNPAIIKLLLDRGADVHHLSNEGEPVLFFAIPSAESVRLLLERGANPSLGRSPANGFTPLMYAAWFEENFESLKVLLEYKPELETRYLVPDEGITDTTALGCAVQAGPPAAVKLLAEAGADLQNTRLPILQMAAAEDKQDKLDVLLEFLPRLNLKEIDSDGWTVIHWNIPHAHLERLLNIGIDPNVQDNDGETPLYRHVANENVAHIKSLLRSGANPNLLTHRNGGPLHRAASDLRHDIVKLLVEHGADLNAASPAIDGTPILSTCLQSSSETLDDSDLAKMVEHLLDLGADPNAASGIVGYAINAAALKGSSVIVDMLLRKGSAKVDLRDGAERTTLHWAASGGNLAVFRKILDAGCDIKARDVTGRTVLQWAVQKGWVEVVEDILGRSYQDGGEDIDTTDKDGWTALCWAARGPYAWHNWGDDVTSEVMDNLAKVVKMLLDHGARKDVEVTFHDEKWTPLRIARYHGAPLETTELLEADKDSGTEVPVQRAAVRKDSVACDVCLVVSGYFIMTRLTSYLQIMEL